MSNIIEFTSILSVPLVLKSYNGHFLGSATGFFWRKEDGRTFLISNYHVFSGNHYITNQSMRSDSAFPALIEYPRFISSTDISQRQISVVELCDAAGNNKTWKPHPLHEEYPVDIAIVEVPAIENDSYLHAINDEQRHECDKPLLRYNPGFELKIVGFFLKDRPTGYFPIHIKGAVASEMDAFYHGKQAFLIDALTSSGMSGSPVFATGLEQENPGEKFGKFKTLPRFVGIYSGRITEEEDGKKRELQVGLVWRRELIQEMVLLF